jgi:hypothetical protein
LLGGKWLTTTESDSPASLAPGGVPTDTVAVRADAVAMHPAPLSPELEELDAKVGDLFARDATLPSNITRGSVIALLQAYKGWFDKAYDGKKSLNDVVLDVGGILGSATQRFDKAYDGKKSLDDVALDVGRTWAACSATQRRNDELFFESEDEDESDKDKGKEAPAASARASAGSAAGTSAAPAGSASASASASTPPGSGAAAAASLEEDALGQTGADGKKRAAKKKKVAASGERKRVCRSRYRSGVCDVANCSENWDHPAVCSNPSHADGTVRNKDGCILWHIMPKPDRSNRKGGKGPSSSNTNNKGANLSNRTDGTKIQSTGKLEIAHANLKAEMAELRLRNLKQMMKGTTYAAVAAASTQQQQQPQLHPLPGLPPLPVAAMPAGAPAYTSLSPPLILPSSEAALAAREAKSTYETLLQAVQSLSRQMLALSPPTA